MDEALYWHFFPRDGRIQHSILGRDEELTEEVFDVVDRIWNVELRDQNSRQHF